jgi:hypothetical protein
MNSEITTCPEALEGDEAKASPASRGNNTILIDGVSARMSEMRPMTSRKLA